MSDNGMDYELHPFTTYAMSMFDEGNDQSCPEERVEQILDALAEQIDCLDDETKGIVIIDLLALANALQQVVTILRVQAIEEASK